MSRLYFFVLLFGAGIMFFSCQEEEFTSDPMVKLEFTTDTITFDTIFSTIGSTTQWFTVKNPSKQTVNISKIQLAGGENSPFRLNINGIQANQDINVRIPGGDSLYIFVEVTIDPTGQNHPMIVQDSIMFQLNGNTQDVNLIAFGQDFHLFDGEVIKTQRWGNDKPYLIYHSVMVDSLETLTIDAGCRIHFHKGSSLFVKGTVTANGTYEQPVQFLGDRLEEDYCDVPGQWGAWVELSNGGTYVYGGIHLLQGSRDNFFNYAVIKNANKGIQIDSMGYSENPMLTIHNSRIENMSLNCIDARTTKIVASNCIFANSGSYSLALLFGGDYQFNHCTVANYYALSTRREPALFMNNYFEYNNTTYSFDFNAVFGNCIVYGNNFNEVSTDPGGSGTFSYLFKNCLLNIKDATGDGFVNTSFNKDPLFTDIAISNYSLSALSPAKNAGNIEIARLFPLDLNNVSRLADEGPDLGAIEWIPAEENNK
ncbi:MAG: hypothetical protein EOM73_09140 [Bacteroidia bacterium]|nr:hypothetical protein [Bacteroidia bacterium]